MDIVWLKVKPCPCDLTEPCMTRPAFHVRYISCCECAGERKTKILFSYNSPQRRASCKRAEDSANNLDFLSFCSDKGNSGSNSFALVKLKDTDQTEMTAEVWAAEPAVEICPNNVSWQYVKAPTHYEYFMPLDCSWTLPTNSNTSLPCFYPIAGSLCQSQVSWCSVS